MTNLWCQGLNIQETWKSQGCAQLPALCFSQRSPCPWVRSVGTFRITFKTTGYDRLFPWFLLVHGLCTVVPLSCTWITCTRLDTLMLAKNTDISFAWSKQGGKVSWGLELLPCSSWVKLSVIPEKGSRAPSFSLPSTSGLWTQVARTWGWELCSDLSILHKVVNAKDGSGGRRWQMPPQTQTWAHTSWAWLARILDLGCQVWRDSAGFWGSFPASALKFTNSQKGLGTKVSHFLRFSAYPEHTNTCIM